MIVICSLASVVYGQLPPPGGIMLPMPGRFVPAGGPCGLRVVNDPSFVAKGMIIDVDHMSAVSFNDALGMVAPTRYPVVSGHTGFTRINHGDQNNEGQRTDGQIQPMLDVGGMFAIIPPRVEVTPLRQW
jgi:hypothetical protein